jgi:arginase
MQNDFIISPSFIDRAVPQLAELNLAGALINDPERLGDDQQAKASCVHRPLAEFVAQSAQRGRRPVSIAGDCCTAIPVVAGLQRAGIDPALIWIDAHGDFNTWETSPSGFLGGMPLAMIAGRGEMTMAEAVGMHPMAESRIVLADGRDLDPMEAEAVANSDMNHIERFSDLLAAPLPTGPLYVHFDTDVIDCAEAPGHNYPVPGGPGVESVIEVMQRFVNTGQVVAVSMSTWNPELDVDGQTAQHCMAAFNALIGNS